MSFLSSLTLTFAMYSKIPMPMVQWNEKSMQWVFPCFPLVGAVVGILLFLWLKIAIFLQLGVMLTAAVAAVLPILVTGGIHLDGLCDTCDALGSNQSRERKLEIMKDPHIGAFGVIGCVVYLLVLFGCWGSVRLTEHTIVLVSMAPVFSRSLVSLAAVTRKNARKTGLLATFTDASAGRWCVVIACLWTAVTAGFFLWWDVTGCWMAGAAFLVAVWFYCMSEKEFGGITGDLAGWYLQMLELGMMLAAALTTGG